MPWTGFRVWKLGGTRSSRSSWIGLRRGEFSGGKGTWCFGRASGDEVRVLTPSGLDLLIRTRLCGCHLALSSAVWNLDLVQLNAIAGYSRGYRKHTHFRSTRGVGWTTCSLLRYSINWITTLNISEGSCDSLYVISLPRLP
jgi:hypothetical protein